MEKYDILVNDHDLGMVDTFKYFLDRSQWRLLTLSEKKFTLLFYQKQFYKLYLTTLNLVHNRTFSYILEDSEHTMVIINLGFWQEGKTPRLKITT